MKAMTVMTLAFLLAASPAVSQVPDDKLIVPGQRIGKWRLEMTIGDLVQMNGPATIIETLAEGPDLVSADFWVHRWPLLRLRVVTLGRESQRVWNLQTFDPAYKTARGIGPQAPQAAVEAAYGRPTAVTQAPDRTGHVLIYDELGLAVHIPFAALSIIVFRSGTAKERWKF